jgi:cation diffusion facilitator CzcD-associated flavoprotein CzcO
MQSQAAKNGSGVDFDVIIIGGGISGVNAAYRVQTMLPGSSYTILEARDSLGGTWDLFRYPGIRSDSDLYTFGFAWRPWVSDSPIASGESIKKYMVETAEETGISKHVQFRRKLVSADWSLKRQIWNLKISDNGSEELQTLTTGFLILGTGYYDYETPLSTNIPGLSNFTGPKIHPQFWPEDLDFTGKKIVIIGSGATAVTLLPNLAPKAAHVTMLQRSPGYVLALPNRAETGWIYKIAPFWLKAKLQRARYLFQGFAFFLFCRAFPNAARKLLKKATLMALKGSNVPFDPHFIPSYNPWAQRLCLCPDGDFFDALKSGKASVATGKIQMVTEKGITLEDGQKLEADMIVTATGLKILFGGGVNVSVDGLKQDLSKKYIWGGIMMQDIPNACMMMGYTNASWTLGADATALLVCRIIKSMKAKNQVAVVPKLDSSMPMNPTPLLNLNSTYIVKALDALPRTGDVGPWRPRNNCLKGFYNAWYGDIKEGLEYSGAVS